MYLKWRKSSRNRPHPSRPVSPIRSHPQDHEHDGVHSDGPSPGRGQNDRTSRPATGNGGNEDEDASGGGGEGGPTW